MSTAIYSAFIVYCNAAVLPMYRLFIYHRSTQRTSPQLHFLEVLQCISRCRDGNATTETYRNAAAVSMAPCTKKPENRVHSRNSAIHKIKHCYLGPIVVHSSSTSCCYTRIHRSLGVKVVHRYIGKLVYCSFYCFLQFASVKFFSVGELFFFTR